MQQSKTVCGFCQASGGDCRYPDDEESEHSKLDRGTLAILKRLAHMEKGLGDLIRDDHEVRPAASQISMPTGSQTPSRPTPRDAGLAEELRASPSHPPSAQIIAQGAEMTVERILEWPLFGLGEEPLPTISLLGQQRRDLSTEGSVFDMDPETLYHLVHNFLANNHTKNPILDVDLLWSQVHTFVQKGVGWDDTSCLILMICAISVLAPETTLERQPGYSRSPERLARAEMFFQAAQRRMGMVYHGNSLLSIQCSFLTAVYLMSTFRILAAWKSFSQASTQCVGWFAVRGRATTEHAQTHVEESLYWSCLKSELELRSELCLPGSSLNETRYPHLYPSPPGLDTRQHPPGPMVGPETREHLERGWFFYLAEIALRRIMNDALTSRYHEGSWYLTTQWWTEGEAGSYFRYVEEYRQQLDTWYDMLPPPMMFDRDPGENVGEPLHGILRSHMIDILDVLYFPAVRALACRPLEGLSPVTVSIAKDGLANAMDRLTICREGFWHRHQGTWIMIRTCSRSALQLLSMAKRLGISYHGRASREVEMLQAMLPDEWHGAVEGVMDCIEYWRDEAPDLGVLLERFKQLHHSH